MNLFKGMRTLNPTPTVKFGGKDMSSEGFLFVSEFVEEMIPTKDKEKIKSLAGGYWEIRVPNNWYGENIPPRYPKSGEAEIVDKEEKIIATVSWETKFFIDEGYFGKYIDAEPTDVKVNYN